MLTLSIDSRNFARFIYYFKNCSLYLCPDVFFRARSHTLIEQIPSAWHPVLRDRLTYYHPIDTPFDPGPGAAPFKLFATPGGTAYQFDLFNGIRYFDRALNISCAFGDIIETPPYPTLVKSRPIKAANGNAILLKLNAVRHFYFVRDRLRFAEKQDRLVWRGRAAQPNRKAFLKHWYDHPRCDIGHYHPHHRDVPWIRQRKSVAQQLQYKFILAIEGNDVASSLKWTLSSNSLCFMARPRYETWFMEGRLKPDKHYVLLRDDYTDLEEKMDHYLAYPDEAEAIIQAAHEWVNPFRNARMERIMAILVLWKYFHLTGQCEPPPVLDS